MTETTKDRLYGIDFFNVIGLITISFFSTEVLAHSGHVVEPAASFSVAIISVSFAVGILIGALATRILHRLNEENHNVLSYTNANIDD